MKNLILTLLLVVMLFGMALAVPAGDLSEDVVERYSEEETDDEFDFL
ncbi:MAG: hypothetical protein IKH77_05215 [Clostridia bacterium]|nr:hypothetical protein [Clostridia bacterium]